MQAIVVSPPKKGIEYVDFQEEDGTGIPVRIRETGICGTDREIVNGQMASASLPRGSSFMVLGHEAIGVVQEDGESIRKGDLVMPVNRRGCGHCLACLNGRPDFCETGGFVEAGIKGMHGFMRETYWDEERYLVRVPRGIEDIAVMAQPLSDLEKSMEEVMQVQNRLPWKCPDGSLGCRKALVVGTGPIGILTSLLLRSYGLGVFISNVREPSREEQKIFDDADITYYNSSSGYSALRDKHGEFDLVFEASGADASMLPQLLGIIKNNGVLGLFGFPRSGYASFSHTDLQNLVYRSIAVVGLINGQKPHFQSAMNRLAAWKVMFPVATSLLITRVLDHTERDSVREALTSKTPGEIKVKIRWS